MFRQPSREIQEMPDPRTYADSMYSFFKRERFQNLAGQAGASLTIVGLTWQLTDHAVLMTYLAIHQALVLLSALCFYSPWTNRRRTKDGLPLFVLESSIVTKLVCGSLFWFDHAAMQNQVFVLSNVLVLAACVAGSIVTLGPLKRLARVTLVCLLLPGALACVHAGLLVIGVALLFFLFIVAFKSVDEMHAAFCELIFLRSESAHAAEVLEVSNVQLLQANHDLEEEMERRIQTERERGQLQEELITASREAGKAEIATGVLHNVGNVMNSVNVTVDVLRQNLRDRLSSRLDAATELLQEHEKDLPEFFASDPRAKHFVPFISELEQQAEKLVEEVDQLREHVDHVNTVVAAQQALATTAGITSRVDLSKLVQGALQLNNEALLRHRIEVTCQFSQVPEIVCDKQKLLQVLVNLISNAKNAIDDRQDDQGRRIAVRLESSDDEVTIEVTDSGVGIEKQNLDRIFQHNFSTRKDRGGHGFGLHHSACSVEEMGGSMTVRSPGRNQGATFTITLPLQPAGAPATAGK